MNRRKTGRLFTKNFELMTWLACPRKTCKNVVYDLSEIRTKFSTIRAGEDSVVNVKKKIAKMRSWRNFSQLKHGWPN